MKKLIIFGLLLMGILLIAGCGEVAKNCTDGCIRYEQYCEYTRQVCSEKNFWGNCIGWDTECSSYGTRCAETGQICK